MFLILAEHNGIVFDDQGYPWRHADVIPMEV
jgi:hypothetical protein